MNEERRPAKTPAELYVGVKTTERLEVLHKEQAKNFANLKKGLQWGVFRPAQFDAKGHWSVRLIGAVTDVSSLHVEVKYPNGTKETISLADLPIELWPLEQLPVEYHPRAKGGPYGECWKEGCHNTLCSRLNSKDGKFYCERCAEHFNFHEPGTCVRPKDLPELPIQRMGKISMMGVQRSINKLGAITLEEFVRRSEQIYNNNDKQYGRD
jgi:hypothetical protein